MKRKSKPKETWGSFEKRVGVKQTGTTAKKVGMNVPNDILVQRMSPNASCCLKKYEPFDTRDFILLDDYEELTLDNIKEACKKFYKAPEGSCDILASDRGPSCTKLEQQFVSGRPHQEAGANAHSCKQYITKTFSANVPVEFRDVFHYNTVYYAVYNGQPITIEQYVDGTFYKYVNNDGSSQQ